VLPGRSDAQTAHSVHKEPVCSPGNAVQGLLLGCRVGSKEAVGCCCPQAPHQGPERAAGSVSSLFQHAPGLMGQPRPKKLLCCENLCGSSKRPTAALKQLSPALMPRGLPQGVSGDGSTLGLPSAPARPPVCSPERRGRVDIISRDRHTLQVLPAAAPGPLLACVLTCPQETLGWD
jgi:hypothetical protein